MLVSSFVICDLNTASFKWLPWPRAQCEMLIAAPAVKYLLSSYLPAFLCHLSVPNMNPGQGMKEPKESQEPQNDRNDHNAVQN